MEIPERLYGNCYGIPCHCKECGCAVLTYCDPDNERCVTCEFKAAEVEAEKAKGPVPVLDLNDLEPWTE